MRRESRNGSCWWRPDPASRRRCARFRSEAGRPLLRPRGTWDELLAVDGIQDAYLDLTVVTDGPDPGLADRARDRFEFLVKIRAEYGRTEVERPSREGRSIVDLYRDYYLADEGVDPPAELVGTLRELVEEVTGAPA